MSETTQDNQPEQEQPPEQNPKFVAKRIGDELGESDKKPRRQILQVVERAGIEFAEQLLADAKDIHDKGGMTIDSGDRKRTLGGIFFYLARRDLPEDIRDDIFHVWRVNLKQRAEHESQFPAFEWDERLPIIEMLKEKGIGGTSDVKVTLTGQPGALERREYLVITTMEQQIVPESLPRGVPQPPLEPLQYVVYISSKQWERIEKEVGKDDDELIVEGYCARDNESDQFAVYATYVTTKKLQKKDRKQNKKAEASSKPNKGDNGRGGSKGRGGKPHGRPERTERSDRSSSFTQAPKGEISEPEPEPIEFDVPDGASDQDLKRLGELHRAAASFRHKIAGLEEKPENQQFGLDMTRKLLKNTERQIKIIEKQYVS